MVSFDETGFPLRQWVMGCNAPQSMAAHAGNEPWILHEPGGHLDVTAATYTEPRRMVSGLKVLWVDAENYSVKLEGARLAGHQK